MAGFFKKIFNRLTNTAEIDWDDLEMELVAGDLGIKLTTKILDDLRSLGRSINADDVIAATRERLGELFPADPAPLVPRADGKPTVIFVVGVNGTGKTTSVAKLGHLLTRQGHSVMLAAADTFRAAAVEQLVSWAERLELPVVTGEHQADPSSVCYTAHSHALARRTDFLICDTAGRLHTRHNLMAELSKIRRTLGKQDESAPHRTLLVIDATTGSNGLNQAREFQKAVPIDGLILTKLDGSGKGGVAGAICQDLGISPHFIGTGEEPEAFKAFEREDFVQNIL
ncbi:MAG: signal recognition particle-docking protein FtsY [Verrucomicrobiales bacterium]